MLPRFFLLSTSVVAASFLSHTGVYAQTVFIHRSDVLIIASGLADPTGVAVGSPFPGQVVNPVFDPIVRTARETGRDHEISIDIPDMDPTRTGPRAGIQEGIAAGANVTVIFPQRAGIKNPTLSGGILVDVSTSTGGPAAAVGLTMQPDTPGAAAEYQITFVALVDLPANLSSITITLDEDVQLPEVPDGPDEGELEVDLSIARSGLPDLVSAGSTVSYELMVTNAGPSDATAVVLTGMLPPGVRVVSATPGQGMCEIANTTVSCRLGAVDSAEEVVVSLTLLAGPSPAGDFAVTGSVTGKESDPNSGNNQVTANIGILALATPAPTVTSVPTSTPTSTPPVTSGTTATSVPTPTLAPTNMPAPTATPVPTPTATAAPTLTLPPDIPSSGTSESPLQRQPSGGLCRFGDVSAAAGAASLLLLMASLAAIPVYRRLRS